jgi:hypothetical protein
MSAVSGTLESTGDAVLREVLNELGNRQFKWFPNNPINCDSVVTTEFVLNWAVIAIIVVGCRYKTICVSGRLCFQWMACSPGHKVDHVWLSVDWLFDRAIVKWADLVLYVLSVRVYHVSSHNSLTMGIMILFYRRGLFLRGRVNVGIRKDDTSRLPMSIATERGVKSLAIPFIPATKQASLGRRARPANTVRLGGHASQS